MVFEYEGEERVRLGYGLGGLLYLKSFVGQLKSKRCRFRFSRISNYSSAFRRGLVG